MKYFRIVSIAIFITALSAVSQSAIFAQDVDVTATVDKASPTIEITNPSDQAVVSGTTLVTANATDDVEVVKVEFYIDGFLKLTDISAPYTFSWDTTSVSNGSHSITAIAYDLVNKSASDTITVSVENKAPASIESPGKESPSKESPGTRRTTLFRIPDEEVLKELPARDRDFLIGIIVGFEVFLILLLIFLTRRKN